MATPDFIVELRRSIGHAPLWLMGANALVLRGALPDAEVLLVRRSDSGEWSPISGIVDPGEDPHVAAIRGVSGSEFVFAGLRHNVNNIRSKEGVDICWVHRNANGGVDLAASRAAAQAMGFPP